MAKEKEETKELKKPFNHVLEIQDGVINVRDIFQRIDEKMKEKQEAKNGKISP